MYGFLLSNNFDSLLSLKPSSTIVHHARNFRNVFNDKPREQDKSVVSLNAIEYAWWTLTQPWSLNGVSNTGPGLVANHGTKATSNDLTRQYIGHV